ncbi:MAG: flippase-like domain-containing protein [Candidatus Riflebacteria bacterium]|nr:flippase-like domain-containing protein [Candidatus Riflebacteria bacterium]
MSFGGKLALSGLAGLAVFGLMAMLLDWRATWSALGHLTAGWIPLILALALGNYLFRFLKWHYYLRLVGVRLPVKESLAIYLSGFMMAVTPGKLGEVVKAFLIKRMTGVKMRVTAPVVLAERITDVVALLVLSAAGAATLHYGQEALAAAAVLTALGIAALSSRSLAMWGLGLCSRLPVLDRLEPKLREAYESMAALLAPAPLLLGTAVSVPAWACEGVAFYLIFAGLQVPGTDFQGPPLLGAVFIYSFSTLVGALSMLPGGLGAAEAGLAGLAVSLFAVPTGIAAAATLLVRLLTLWFAVALGAATFAAFRLTFGVGFGEVDSVRREE